MDVGNTSQVQVNRLSHLHKMRDEIKEYYDSYQGQQPLEVKRSLQSLLPIAQGASRLHKEPTGFVALVIKAISDVFNIGQLQQRNTMKNERRKF